MAKNNLYTLSYFRKRLKEAEITSKVLINDYPKNDDRYWTISIDSNLMILCTCIKVTDEFGEQEFFFKFTDEKQKIVIDKIIKTKSMVVILDFLNRIINSSE